GPEAMCTIEGARFRAQLSSHGASLRHLQLKDYGKPSEMPDGLLASIKHLIVGDPSSSNEPMDLVSTTLQTRMPLRTDIRAPLDAQGNQVAYDDLDWKLASSDGKSCVFTFEDATTKLTKTVAATGEPFQLSVELTVQNLANEPKRHRFAIEQTDWRKKK